MSKIVDSYIVGSTQEQVCRAKVRRSQILAKLQELKQGKESYEQEAYDYALKVLESNQQATFWLQKTNWEQTLLEMVRVYESISDQDLGRMFGGKKCQ